MKYTLMNKNTPVFELEVEYSDVVWVGNCINSRYAPVSIQIDDGVVIRPTVSDWFRKRSIPASRDNLETGLKNINLDFGTVSTAFLLEKCFALSLSDQYWLKPVGSSLEWKDINYFTNNFSEDVGKALFDNIKIESPNLNSPCNTSDGWLRKKWTVIDGKRCLVKGSSGTLQQEAYNEVIASKACELLGISHTEYTLHHSDWHSFSVCENFIDENTELVTANDILKAFLPNPRKSPYEHFITCCSRLDINAADYIDEMMVLDFIVGNTDRHLRNFGFIRNVNSLEFIGASPVFDTGTSLFHNIPDKNINAVADISSKPFAEKHSEQIKLVKKPERFEVSHLKELPAFAHELLLSGSTISDERASLLSDVLKNRITMLERELCKGYVSGIDEASDLSKEQAAAKPVFIPKQSHGRGR